MELKNTKATTKEPVKPTRKLTCLLEEFLKVTEFMQAPQIYNTWGLISLVCGCLETRVWISSSMGRLYPNMFIYLVGDPATGKSTAINLIKRILSAVDMKLASDSLTKASLVDELAEAITVDADDFYSHLNVAVAEWGLFGSGMDTEFRSFLCNMFDVVDSYKETRRKLKEPIRLQKPSLNMLVGVQPSVWAETFPPEALSQGLPRRCIPVFAESTKIVDIYNAPVFDTDRLKEIIRECRAITTLRGEFTLTEEARKRLSYFHTKDYADSAPTSMKLKYYKFSRGVILPKLCMAFSVIRGNSMTITEEDYQSAYNLLLHTEESMHYVFSGDIHTEFTSNLNEIYQNICDKFRTSKNPVPESRIRTMFMHRNVPPERITGYIDAMVNDHMLEAVRMKVTRVVPGTTAVTQTVVEMCYKPVLIK